MSDDEQDEDAIYKRRNRLIALALSGATIAASQGLGGCVPCLSPAIEDAGPEDAGQDAGPDAGR